MPAKHAVSFIGVRASVPLLVMMLDTAGLAGQASVTYVQDGRLQSALDAAPAYSTVIADRTARIEVASTVRINKPVTLVGLNARLKPSLGKTPMIEILSEGVQIRNFLLEGNAPTVPQADRAPLILVRRGRFLIEDGETNNSAKDGVMITPVPEFGHIEHGVVRNLTSRGTIRDTVSIGGAGDLGLFVRHLVVENIRAYGSRMRGPAEVSDGAEFITVRDLYAEDCFYGIDVQDHNRKGQVNRHVIIDGVHVKNTRIAIRTANHAFGHDGLTIRNVTGVDWPGTTGSARPVSRVDIQNTANVLIENVRIHGCPQERSMQVRNSGNVTIRDVAFVECGSDGPALAVEDSGPVLIDGVLFQGKLQPETGVLFRVRANQMFRGLRIHNVVAEAVRGAGIVVENQSKSGGLASWVITGNIATVRAQVQANQGIVRDNLPGVRGAEPQ